jgi:hypothetical protein
MFVGNNIRTVADLRRALDAFDDDTRIVLATQPAYPVFNTIYAVGEYIAGNEDLWAKENETVAAISQGQHLGYGQRDLW